MEDTEPSSELRPQQPSPVAADPADLAGPSSQQPWKYDIATEHASLTTTGGRIWDAARRLASYLEAMSGPLGLQRPGLRVLELGAGLGWLGMTLARNIRVDPGQGGMVVLTEQEAGGGLDWLRHNLRLNAAALGLQGEGLLEGGLQQGGPQAAASVGQQEGQGGEGGQQQPAVRAEACDWFLYCNPDLTTARAGAGAGAGDRGDQGSQGGGGGGGGGGGAIGAAAGSATGQATASADAGTAAASRRYAEPLAPGASLAAAGLAAAATTTAATTAATAVAATVATTAATAAAAGAAGGTGADGCSGSGGSGTGAGSGAGGGGGGGGGEWLSGVAWDLIIGSDLVYNEVGAVYLPRVLRALSRPGHTRVLYAHTKHRFDTWDMRFYEELAAQGLSLAEVWETGAPSPPPSPPPLTELFPDMRVAVFQIGQQPPPS
ncbi:hypothetical protein CHLRE_14g632839v5 [Chlamydomonas reinhardtii]|uniref:Uncharacterized protein n=1 Tax=Chlamydomonas reinhardtii TaxID=3055 RepID=A0A2K3CYW4_CHLRE|nr:uncharacterized protein CHLRE_14g632815v5 [Chlamydomonas reinhardtii]XP_042917120.1 uncharacterized protein CHLRE_14g632839v5 [Chlamydomonas reinhardtii]PNW73462.1 hypothetical protein CHLRE_14g632815v5 [Chlamydomonas reinhardtii]PNW73465.1 hypothetical protein CHLRE_14g632839v5 [Chlamydomonas reinhardtii]